MEDHIVIDDSSAYTYRLVWYLAETNDYGGYVGENYKEYTMKDVEKEKNFEEKEVILADVIAKKSAGVEKDDRSYYWESLSAAKKALCAVNAALKSLRSEKPWPEWAIQAQSAGWKPPKGWRP